MAKRLEDAGFTNFTLIEKNGGVGGTWHLNRYPGCACDIQSHLYSFSFAIKHDWTRPYAPQSEILAYMEGIADTYGLLSHCRFGDGVRRAVWDEPSATWTLSLDSGEAVVADAVISAVGMFNDLSWPDIDGLETFGGTVFHSGRWDWDHDLTGERVAVIGSAASAVQFVPEIATTVGRLHLFQRSANWVLPKLDDPFTETELDAFRADTSLGLSRREQIFQRVDQGMTFADPQMLAESEAAGLAAIATVADPEVRAKLRPTHPYGCKRPLFSNHYYKTFNRPNVELVTEPIDHITVDSIVTADGVSRRVDTLIVATGFAATKYLSAIDTVGRDGARIDAAWQDGAQAYLGITTAGFPNLFMLYGPNTNNGSILTMIEYQVDHILLHLRRLADGGVAWADVTPAAMAGYNEEVQRAIGEITVWQAGCNGYYRSRSGRVVTQWPFSMSEFRDRTASIDPEAFEVAAL